MAKRKRVAPRTGKRTAVQNAVAIVVDGERDPEAFHWADPLFPPFADRYLPHGVALTYEEWIVYTGTLMSTGLWQH